MVLFASAGAHEGHEHEEAPDPKVEATEAGPSLELRSSRIEMLVVRETTTLTIYIDDYASNAPLAGLRVQARIGARVLAAAAGAPGIYRIPADLLGAAGALPVSFTVHGDALDEELAGDLPAAPEPALSQAGNRGGPAATIVLVLLSALGLTLVGRFWKRKTPEFPA